MKKKIVIIIYILLINPVFSDEKMDLGLEVYDSFNSGAGVRLYKINLRENFLPFPLPLIDSVVAEKVGRNFDEKVKILGEE